MSEKKEMSLGELEAVIKNELCSDDEVTRQQAQAKLLEEGSEIVAKQLAQKSKYLASSPYADFIIETLMKMPLTVKLKALESMTMPYGKSHPYQEIGKKALVEAIQTFKDNKDIENLLKIKNGYASQDILELALKALEELGKQPKPLKPVPNPTLTVNSLKDVTIADDWVRCNAHLNRLSLVFVANFCVNAGIIQPVQIKGKTETNYKQEREYLMSQGFVQTSSRDDGEFTYYWFKRQ